MKTLMKTPKTIWILIAIFITIAILFLIFLLTYQVETTLNASIRTEGSTKSLYVTSDVAYKINESDNIIIRIGDKAYSTSISKIEYDKTLKLYKIGLNNLSINLLPESILQATIITGKQTIGSFLFGGV